VISAYQIAALIQYAHTPHLKNISVFRFT